MNRIGDGLSSGTRIRLGPSADLTTPPKEQTEEVSAPDMSSAAGQVERLSPSISPDLQSEVLEAAAAATTTSNQSSREVAAKPPAEGRLTMSDAAYGEAFAQFVENDKSNWLWLTSYSRQAAIASPVLLILTLERIASHNSRWAGKLALAKPPRSWRSGDSNNSTAPLS
jgi:hypothetical protein